MVITLLFALGIASSFGGGLSYKAGSAKLNGKPFAPALLCMIYTAMAAAIYAVVLFTVKTPVISLLTVAFAAMSGISLTVAAVLFLLSLECGPYTISTALLNFSTFLPILYSHIFLGEEVTPKQLFFLVLLLGVIMVLVFANGSKGGGKFGKKWIFYITLTVLTNGLINFGIRCHTKFVPGRSEEILFMYFVMAFAASAALFVFFGGLKRESLPMAKSFVLPAVGLALSLGVNMIAQVFLPAMGVSSAVQYPIICTGSVMLSTLAGRLLFKDKLKPVSYAALAAGIGLIVLIST